MSARPIRIVLAKAGLDGHDRGVKIIARLLRDAGMEVIYAGLHNTPEQVVTAAIQEDADALGISILSGAHLTIVPRVLSLLRQAGAEDVPVVVGGLIPEEDTAELTSAGVAAVFDQDTPVEAIPGRVREVVEARRAKAAADR
jgi:methylmalonyl-CoA mutase C-terminal domain/subunit